MQSKISKLEATVIILDVCFFFHINTGQYTHVNRKKKNGKVKIERRKNYWEGLNICCLSPSIVSHPLILSTKLVPGVIMKVTALSVYTKEKGAWSMS